MGWLKIGGKCPSGMVWLLPRRVVLKSKKNCNSPTFGEKNSAAPSAQPLLFTITNLKKALEGSGREFEDTVISCGQRQPTKGRQNRRSRFCRPYTWKIVPISNVVLFRYGQKSLLRYLNDTKKFFGLKRVLENSDSISKKEYVFRFFSKKLRLKSSKMSKKKFLRKNHFFLGHGCF